MDVMVLRPKDARKFLEKYKRLDAAIDSYYNDPDEFAGSSKKSDTDRIARLNAIFDKYKGSSALLPLESHINLTTVCFTPLNRK